MELARVQFRFEFFDALLQRFNARDELIALANLIGRGIARKAVGLREWVWIRRKESQFLGSKAREFCLRFAQLLPDDRVRGRHRFCFGADCNAECQLRQLRPIAECRRML